MADPTAVRAAIISGLGISRIGRRLEIHDGLLTEEASRLAIADAGLAAADIDGIATIGDTPLEEAATRLGATPTWTSGGMGRYGLLTPVVEAFEAVGTGAARHVLVYRTVNMMGGEATGAGAGDPGRLPPSMRDIGRILTMHAYSAANWLAMHLRRHMYLYGTTREQVGWIAVNSRRNAALIPVPPIASR